MKKILLLLLLAGNCCMLYAQEIQKDSLKGKEEELDEVIIQSTRTSRTIRNTYKDWTAAIRNYSKTVIPISGITQAD